MNTGAVRLDGTDHGPDMVRLRILDSSLHATIRRLTAAGPDWAYDKTEAVATDGGYPEPMAHSVARGMTQAAYALLGGLDFFVQEYDAEDIAAGSLTPEDKEMAAAIAIGLLPSDGSVAFVSGLVNREDGKPFWFVVAVHD